MVPFTSLHLDARKSSPLHRQLYAEIRSAVLSGRLAAGARLPSTRSLAADLGVSRNTVAGAFDQLMAEGYLEGRVGAGTFVTDMGGGRVTAAVVKDVGAVRLSVRGERLADTRISESKEVATARAFRPGVPALDAFPRELWARMSARVARRARPETLTYGAAAGSPALRQAIADYLRAARGVRCSGEQVVVTSGSQQALDLTARVLLDAGETAWVEDPSYLGARGAFQAAGVVCAPVALDAEGLSVADGEARAPEARLVYVSPSHQYPMGMTMSLGRRMALLEWARRRRAWIVEDDYDSEFRYAGRPLASLQGLDTADRVIYTGTFSKVLFPALRLGYLVAPEAVASALASAKALVDRQSPGLDQALVAEFLAEGHFARHVRRMRALYRERQEALVAESRKELAGRLDVEPSEAGMHVIGWLRGVADDAAAARSAAGHGVATTALSAYAVRRRVAPGLVMGYACVTPRQIREGVRKLAAALGG
jgi:GntR family transcriptional regulator / MocR family aminotransferase